MAGEAETMDYLGIDDDEFIRDQVPMTKQEIRILSLVKARIKPDAVIYDIGAGTGSLSVEAARLAALSAMVWAVACATALMVAFSIRAGRP